MRCDLAPGERLVIDDLARRLRVSIIPVREALRLLQSEGLVVIIAHVGATVAPISQESMVEVFTLLEGLEVVATRVAAQQARRADLAALRMLVAEMEDAIDAGSPQRWAEINTRFHLAICRIAGDADAARDDAARASTTGIACAATTSRACSSIARGRRRPSITRSSSIWRRAICRALEQTVREHNQAALASYTAHLESTPSG